MANDGWPGLGPAVPIVDVYVVAVGLGGLAVLSLRRGKAVPRGGAWEAVHGHVDDGETPVVAACRELLEETGLVADRLYNLSRVEMFHLHHTNQIAVGAAFAAVVRAGVEVRLSGEHDRYEWVDLGQAAQRFAWPRERRAVQDLAILLPDGTAGPLDDVLRVVD